MSPPHLKSTSNPNGEHRVVADDGTRLVCSCGQRFVTVWEWGAHRNAERDRKRRRPLTDCQSKESER